MYFPGANLWNRLRTLLARTTTDLIVQLPATTNQVIVRRAGAAPGDTNNAFIEIANSGYASFGSSGETNFRGSAVHLGPTVFASFVTATGSALRIRNGSHIGWSSSGTDTNGSAADTYFNRAAAGVIICGFSGDMHWIQNSAGLSRVANNVTNVGTTPAAITGLSATLKAGRKYTGRLVVFCNSATAADGVRFDFDGGTATMTSFNAMGTIADTLGVRALQPMSTALATDFTDTLTTGDAVAVIEFSLVCANAGTFIPRFAKEADAAGATGTVYANSYMWLEDTP